MYKVKYNYIDLDEFGIVTSLKKSILPSRKYSSFSSEISDGEVYNGSKYEPLEINIVLFVEGKTETELKEKLLEIATLFNTKQVLPLELDNKKFAYAITNDEIETEEFSNLARYVKINLICLDPHFYSLENKNFDSENNLLKVINNGGENVLPFVSVGFSKDAHFVQLNKGGEKILVGDYPKLTLTSKKESNKILRDNCETTSNWINAQPPIDSDRTMGGTLSINSAGSGICIGSLPTGSTTWKGVCARQNLSKVLDEFHVRCRMHHNSTGKNGDPTYPTMNDTETVTSGSKETYYKVTASTLNYRSGPGTNYSKYGTLKKGFEIYNGTPTNGWLKFTYKDKTCYCSTKYLTRKVKTTQVTTSEKNFIAKTKANLRSDARKSSTLLATLKIGDVIRCITTAYTDPDNKDRKYYKLAKKYNGKIGYVCTADITEARNVSFDYDAEEDYLWADHKMGIIELYLFDENGSKLGKVGMYDDNEWYEYTYPMAQIGTRTVLKDNTKVPAPRSITSTEGSNDSYTIKTTNYMSGKLGDYNEFYGEWNIIRKKVNGKYVWEVSVIKIKDGVIVKTNKEINIKYTDLPTGKLSYIAVYMGTTGELSNASAVDLTHLEVLELNPQSEVEENIAYFEKGDILDIDFETGKAYLNEIERTDLIDVGSELFEIKTGTNNIKIVSDDKDVTVSAVIKEKWIGSD